MANKLHLQVLKQGVKAWNAWRRKNPHIRPDLIGAIRPQTDLSGANLAGVDLTAAGLIGTNLESANLRKANLTDAHLGGANLSRANLKGATLNNTNFSWANLTRANLTGAFLEGALFVKSDLSKATLTGSWIFGVSAWDVRLDGAKQLDLVVTPLGEPEIRVDNLEVAQFVYLLLHNQKIRSVIDTVTSKVVLILGRFSSERKPVLESIRDSLRRLGYAAVMFNFQPSLRRDLTETIHILASMAKFVVADLTDAKSIPQELAAVVPHLPSVPIQPILLASQREYALFEHWRRFPWVLPEFVYKNERHLLAHLEAKVIKPASSWTAARPDVQALSDRIVELEAQLATRSTTSSRGVVKAAGTRR